eukprot:880648-Pelagomonas_calceolata.AAC.1
MRRPEITPLASYHPNIAYNSILGHFQLPKLVSIIPIYTAKILHIKKEKKRSGIDLFGTPCAGTSPREMCWILSKGNG